MAGGRGIVGYRNEEEAAAACDTNFPVWAYQNWLKQLPAKWPNLWLNSLAVNGKFKAKKKKQNAVSRAVCSRKAGMLCKRV